MSSTQAHQGRLKSVFPPGFDSISSDSKGYSTHYVYSIGQLFTALIDNYSPMTPSDNIIVRSTWYGKQTTPPRHEFILIQVEDKRDEERDGKVLINYLVLDRNVVGKHAKSRRSSRQSQTSIRGAQPVDSFRVSYDGDVDRLLDDCNLRPHVLIGSLEFSGKPPFLYELVALAQVVSAQNPDYRAINSNCYMYAGLIWESLHALYPTATRDRKMERERGKYGWTRYIVDMSQVADIRQLTQNEISRAKSQIDQKKGTFQALVYAQATQIAATMMTIPGSIQAATVQQQEEPLDQISNSKIL